MARPIDAMTIWTAATLVGGEQRSAHYLVDRRHGLDKLAAAFAEIRGGKIFEIHRTASQSCPRESEVESSVNPFIALI
jgi:hypothetical protein